MLSGFSGTGWVLFVMVRQERGVPCRTIVRLPLELEFYGLWFSPSYCQFWNVRIRSFTGFSSRKSSIVVVGTSCCRSFEFSKGGGAIVHCCAESVGHNLV